MEHPPAAPHGADTQARSTKGQSKNLPTHPSSNLWQQALPCLNGSGPGESCNIPSIHSPVSEGSKQSPAPCTNHYAMLQGTCPHGSFNRDSPQSLQPVSALDSLTPPAQLRPRALLTPTISRSPCQLVTCSPREPLPYDPQLVRANLCHLQVGDAAHW